MQLDALRRTSTSGPLRLKLPLAEPLTLQIFGPTTGTVRSPLKVKGLTVPVPPLMSSEVYPPVTTDVVMRPAQPSGRVVSAIAPTSWIGRKV